MVPSVEHMKSKWEYSKCPAYDIADEGVLNQHFCLLHAKKSEIELPTGKIISHTLKIQLIAPHASPSCSVVHNHLQALKI